MLPGQMVADLSINLFILQRLGEPCPVASVNWTRGVFCNLLTWNDSEFNSFWLAFMSQVDASSDVKLSLPLLFQLFRLIVCLVLDSFNLMISLKLGIGDICFRGFFC